MAESERYGGVNSGRPVCGDAVLLAGTEGMLQRVVDEFDRVYKMRKLRFNAEKS